MAEWRNRVIERRIMKVNQVAVNKRNPKTHPYQQKERLKSLLDKFGMVSGGLLAFYDEENLDSDTGEPTLTLFDGHARQGLDPNQEWEICITDLSRKECDELVLMFDPIAALAQADASRQMDLMQDLRSVDGVLGAFLDELARESGFVRGENGHPPSLDDLEQQYGEPQERDFWPFIRVQVSPQTMKRWNELIEMIPGEDDAEQVKILLEAIDEAVLSPL